MLLQDKVEFIKQAFQMYVGNPGTSGLEKFLAESPFEIGERDYFKDIAQIIPPSNLSRIATIDVFKGEDCKLVLRGTASGKMLEAQLQPRIPDLHQRNFMRINTDLHQEIIRFLENQLGMNRNKLPSNHFVTITAKGLWMLKHTIGDTEPVLEYKPADDGPEFSILSHVSFEKKDTPRRRFNAREHTIILFGEDNVLKGHIRPGMTEFTGAKVPLIGKLQEDLLRLLHKQGIIQFEEPKDDKCCVNSNVCQELDRCMRSKYILPNSRFALVKSSGDWILEEIQGEWYIHHDADERFANKYEITQDTWPEFHPAKPKKY